jgi:transposase
MDGSVRRLAALVWEFLEPRLPAKPEHPKGGRPFADDFQALLGVCFVLKTGARWKDIPKHAVRVHYSTCHRRLTEWAGEEVFEQAWADALAELARRRAAKGRTGAVDGSYVRGKKGATTSAAAARGTAAR